MQEASELDDDDSLVAEATVGAVTRLGMFIGEKVLPPPLLCSLLPAPCSQLPAQVYNSEFACQCPCHPDRRL
jgi:hypothetical protein